MPELRSCLQGALVPVFVGGPHRRCACSTLHERSWGWRGDHPDERSVVPLMSTCKLQSGHCQMVRDLLGGHHRVEARNTEPMGRLGVAIVWRTPAFTTPVF